MVKELIKQKLKAKFPSIDFDILVPPDDKMGDYSTNAAFALAKSEGKGPMKVGEKLVSDLRKDKDLSDIFEKVEVVKPGFVNFFLKKEFLQKRLAGVYKKLGSFGQSDTGRGKTVIVDYGGTNIAKPMHVGHLRSTIIGDGLANVYELLGYKVVRWNYIGDWGTQFGKLIAAYKLWGNEDELKAKPIQTMLDLYVRFHDELKNNPDLEERGREEFKKLEEGDADNRKLWEMFREYSLEEFDTIFRQLGIKFDITKGESGYESVIGGTVELIKQKGILKKSEGADIVEFGPALAGLPPALIRKSDGTSLYITRDIASLLERVEEHRPAKILYVVANQQALHFEQLFAIWRMLGFTGTELIHVKFGMVLGEDGKKLATREGKVVPLQEVIDKIVAIAGKAVKEKNPELSEKESDEIAKAVGIGALKYSDLKQHPHTDIVFDWEAMLDISGNSGPYLQYTYARLQSIIKNSKKFPPLYLRKHRWYLFPNWFSRFLPHPLKTSALNLGQEVRLIKQILKFPDTILESAEANTLNGLALYLYNLASQSNYYYETVGKLSDYSLRPERNARLMLVETVASVLERGLGLLGISVLKRI